MLSNHIVRVSALAGDRSLELRVSAFISANCLMTSETNTSRTAQHMATEDTNYV